MERIFFLGALALCTTQSWSQNDCSSALPITAGLYTVASVDGSATSWFDCGDELDAQPQAEWYVYTPANDLSLTITTVLPQNTLPATHVTVYRGTCGSVICNGWSIQTDADYRASLTIPVTADTSYLIAFDDRYGDEGFDFELIEGPMLDIAFTANHVDGSFTWGAVDMNGDHLDDHVSIYDNYITVNEQLEQGGLNTTVIMTPVPDAPINWSLAAGDLNADGFNDLLYGGGSGVTFMLSANGGTSFTEQSGPEFVLSQRSNMVDINNDGHLDAFVSHDVDANVYYINDGNGNLTFYQGGFGETCGHYASLWTDYDNDHDIDLYSSNCGCDTVDALFRNNGDGTFTEVAADVGLSEGRQNWSSGWADLDNDGDMDMVTGSSGDNDIVLMRNDGGFFTNITAGSGLDTMSGNGGIEWVCHDFDNDGYGDIFGGGSMENYGGTALYLNNGDLTFAPISLEFGHGPVGDLNNDGFLDIASGYILRSLYLNYGNANGHLTVSLVGTVSNPNGIGARIEVVSPSFTQIREVRSGDGFQFMSSLNAYFGLGSDAEIQQVTVHWPSGIVDVLEDVQMNAQLVVVEGSFPTDIAEAGRGELTLFPDPADEMLSIRSTADLNGRPFTVFDDTGKKVLSGWAHQGSLDISSLGSGLYVLRIEGPNGPQHQRFIKR